jgi:hypothetical protein
MLEDFGSYAAMIAEVSIVEGALKTDRILCAVDCGQVVNPDTVEAQIQGGIIYGLSAALYGRITVADSMVVESNFDDSPVLRMHETPKIDVYIVPSSQAPGGIGGKEPHPNSSPQRWSRSECWLALARWYRTRRTRRSANSRRCRTSAPLPTQLHAPKRFFRRRAGSSRTRAA